MPERIEPLEGVPVAVCTYCDQEMQSRVSCTLECYDDFPDGVVRSRLPNSNIPCKDCGTPPDGLHHPGCDSERCPACDDQAISCACIVL